MLSVELFLFCGKLCMSIERAPGLEIWHSNDKAKMIPVFESVEKLLYTIDERFTSYNVISDLGKFSVVIPKFLSERKIRIEEFSYVNNNNEIIMFNLGTKEMIPSIVYFVSSEGEINHSTDFQIAEISEKVSLVINSPSFTKMAKVQEIYLG